MQINSQNFLPTTQDTGFILVAFPPVGESDRPQDVGRNMRFEPEVDVPAGTKLCALVLDANTVASGTINKNKLQVIIAEKIERFVAFMQGDSFCCTK